jgi:GT2 family glycosyltransferase
MRASSVGPVAVRIVELDTDAADVDLARPAAAGPPYRRLLAVPRAGGVLRGLVALDVGPDGRVPLARIRDAAAALPQAAGPPAPPADAPLPSACVVVTTCRDPGAVRRCLRSLLAGDRLPTEVVVVENRPGGSPVPGMLAEEFGHRAEVRYVEEPERGLSSARNAGLRRASADVVVFTDDDVVADRLWLHELCRALADPTADCATGMILPLSLDTPAQVTFEEFAGFGKGFDRRRHSLADPPPDPLYPYTAGQIGSGANTAIRRDVALALGGFDPLLGAGTPAYGGEDLDLFLRLLLAGRTILYEPGAVIFHDHPPGAASLRRHAVHYGLGLTAMLAKHVVHGPDRLGLARRVPAGIRYLRDPDSRKNAAKTADYPRALNHLERLGMALGPVAYARSALRARSAGGPRPRPAAGARAT